MVATQFVFIFTPNLGEDEPILTHIFSKGLVRLTNHQRKSGFLGLLGDLVAGYGSVLGFCPRYLEYLHWLARESGDDGGGAFVPWRLLVTLPGR